MKIHYTLFRIVLMFLAFNGALFGQYFSYKKMVFSKDGISVYEKRNTEEGLLFSKQESGSHAQQILRLTRQNLTKTDVMWDVWEDEVYYIRFRKNVDYLTCNISAFQDSIHMLARDDESKYSNYNVYTKPPSLEESFIQAFIFENKKPVDFYQPYDFLIDADGVYFIVANMHDNNYELWHYSGPFFPNLDPNDRKRVDAFTKSKKKWKKIVLTGIQEQPEQANIALVKNQGRLLMFTAQGRVYQINKKRPEASFIGNIDRDFSDLLMVINKKTGTVSYLKQSETALESKDFSKVSMLSLNDILQEK